MAAEVVRIVQQIQGLLGELASALEDGPLSALPHARPAGSAGSATRTDPRAEKVYYAPRATYRVRDGVTLAIDGETPHWVTTNATGAAVLRGCSGGQTVGELAAGLSARQGVGQDIALADTLAFLEQLEAIGYVRQSPRLAPPYRGRDSAIRLGRLADLYLFLTNDCNLRCSHCYVSSGDDVPPREMTTGEVLALIDQARELGVGRFLVTGGEPFMVREIFAIIRHITAESDLVLLTNGLFLSEKYLRRLAESTGRGRVSLQVSVDGPVAAMHDAIRGPGTFEKALAGIRRAVAAGVEVSVSTALGGHNIEHMVEMTRLVASLGVRTHHILWMQEWGRALDHRPELMTAPARVTRVMRECRAAGDALGVTIDNDASLRVRVKGKHGRKTDLCSCGWDSLAVFSDGQVYPCVWLAGAPGMACGSVLEQPLDRIWRQSHTLDQLRAVSVQNREKCSDCHLKYLCAGGSPCSSHFASLATRGKSDLRSAEPYCETFLDLTHDMLWELGTAGVGPLAADGGYQPPRLLRAMEGAGAVCARPNTVSIDRAFEVGSYHCVCVLESDVPEGAAVKAPTAGVDDAASDPHRPAAVFDAIGQACIELLLPMAEHVRALELGKVLRVATDDLAAGEDLAAWCRMTGNSLIGRSKADGYSNYYIRRGGPA